MATMKNSIGFDLVEIITRFDMDVSIECQDLDIWMTADYQLNGFEEQILEDLFLDIEISGEYMNEEELKARMVGLMFYGTYFLCKTML